MLEFLKLLVQPVILERDDDGQIIGEKLAEPVPLYSTDDLISFVETLHAQIAELNAKPSENGKADIVVPERMVKLP